MDTKFCVAVFFICIFGASVHAFLETCDSDDDCLLPGYHCCTGTIWCCPSGYICTGSSTCLSIGIIVGPIVGLVVLIVCIVVCCICCRRRRQQPGVVYSPAGQGTQGYAPPPQGYAPAPQGYAPPPQQGYPVKQ